MPSELSADDLTWIKRNGYPCDSRTFWSLVATVEAERARAQQAEAELADSKHGHAAALRAVETIATERTTARTLLDEFDRYASAGRGSGEYNGSLFAQRVQAFLTPQPKPQTFSDMAPGWRL